MDSTSDANAVDAYLEQVLGFEDPVLTAVLRASDEAGLPPIAVSPAQGRFLTLLVEITSAARVLEVGTLGGYSAISLARGGAHVTTLELDAHHAEVAVANAERAGLGDRIDVVVGPALETLPGLSGPYDLVFIDADKQSNAAYVRAAIGLSRPGTLIVVDNVVRGGRVVEADSTDPSVVGTREVLALLGSDDRLSTATALQTVGSKGWDGFAVARVV